MYLQELLRFAIQHQASDLHLSAGVPPMIRLHGEMKRLDAPPLEAETLQQIVYGILLDRQRQAFEEDLEFDFAVQVKGIGRFRVNVFNQLRGKSAVFRVIPEEVIPLHELGLPPILRRFTEFENGLVLVTGPTGSGKSTTLAAIIDSINTNHARHIITIEDPIEFVHRPKKSLVQQRELHAHTHSFANALKSALREDPDVILVGELRDLETISLALTAAETGHLVFATLHTNSAPKTIDRVIDVFPANQQAQIRAMLSQTIRAVVTQTLLPTRNKKGRVAALEIMIANAAIRNLIREGKLFQIHSIMQTSQGIGMQTLEQVLKDFVMKGKISREVAAEKLERVTL
ncbi:MAG: type IV pilus twitching motility protein PilT [Deltaproteobacteria bacterium]|nr:MAG: type IV pilus twitching motility protein PilT [Deltaproteobacteria bacterium]